LNKYGYGFVFPPANRTSHGADGAGAGVGVPGVGVNRPDTAPVSS
jgi:hypothetical protein